MAEKIEDEVVEHTNPRDEIADDVRSAIASLKGEAPEAAEGPPPAEVAEPEAPLEEVATKGDHPTDPKRYDDGTFKPVKTDAAPDKAAAPETKIAPPSDSTTKASAPQPSTAAGAPPVSWAADAKAQWAALPPAIQTAVLKREQEASNGFAQYSEKVKAYEQALSPVAQEAQRRGMNLTDGIKRLLDGNTFIEQQPAEAILWLAQKHGLDLAQLATNPPAFQQPARSEAIIPPQFVQHVSNLEERLNSILMDQNMSAVEQFAQANPHYTDVEDQLPAIMRELTASNPSLKGSALLQQAYDRAIWLNPDVRGKLIAEQHTQTTQTRTQQVAAKASQASRAAVSIRGSSSSAPAPRKPEVTGNDVYADVKASIEQLRAN